MNFTTLRPERLKRELEWRSAEIEAVRAKNGGSLEGVTGEDASRVRLLSRELRSIGVALDEQTPGTLSNGQPMRHPAPPGGYSGKAGDQVALTKGQSMSDWLRSKGQVRREQENLSLAKFVRGLALGRWDGADAERKGLLETVAADGGYLVPTPLSGSLIDLVRNASRVMQAGSTTVPMTSQTLRIARQISDPTPVWHAEGQSDISASGPTFDSVLLTAHTLVVLVKLSLEILEDATVSGGADLVVENAISQALALELDRACLYGSGTSNQPTGVRNQSGVTSQVLATNGQTPTSYDFLVDAVFNQRGLNFEPNAMIENPRSEQTLAKLKDSQNRPLQQPAALDGIPRLMTNQVPVNLTQGTANNASDVFVGQWQHNLVGMRTEVTLQVLRERFLGDTGEVGIFAHLRADAQLAHPGAFTIVKGVLP